MRFKNLITLTALVILCSTVNQELYADQITSKQEHTFEQLAQEHCFFSENLFIRVRKVKDNTLYISDKNKETIEYAYTQFNKEVDAVRYKFYNDQQEEAVTQFTDYLLSLCNKFNLKNYYLFSFPETSAHLTIQEKLKIGNKAQKALEGYYESIKPYPPVLKQLENILLYNFISTKIVPKLVSLSGPALSAFWFKYKISNATESSFNPLCKYEEIEHDSKSNTVETWYSGIQAFMQQVFDKYSGQQSNADTPCKNKSQGHVCKANEDGLCYKNLGFDTNPLTLGAKLAPKFDFALPFFGMRYLGNLMEEYQLPKYKERIKKRAEQVDQKKVEQEMRNLKIQYEKDIDFSSIKGQKELIDNEIRIIVDYLNHPFKYKDKGTLSTLFFGPPGNGKTLFARAIAKESGAPFIEINADDMLHENAKEKVLALWRLAEKVAAERQEKSAIIYIDEIDNVVGNRSKAEANGKALDPVRAKALANLLSILDGIEKRNPYLHIVIIICTNHHKNLDEALTRPGRIDDKICITVPTAQGRKEFFDLYIHEQNKHLIPNLIKRSEGLSGAEIKGFITKAERIAQYNHRPIPTPADYDKALDNMLLEKDKLK